jgi:natural product precursor
MKYFLNIVTHLKSKRIMKKESSKLKFDKMTIVSLSEKETKALIGGKAKSSWDYCTLSGYCETDFCTITVTVGV